MKKVNRVLKKLKSTGFFYIFGSSVINKILSFFSGVIIVRLISKSDYGVYSYAGNILSMFMIFNGAGMASGMLQLCSENFSDIELRDKIYYYGSRIGIAFNIFVSVLLLIVSIFIKLPVEGANQYLFWMSLLPIFLIVVDYQQTFFRFALQNKKFSVCNSTNATITVLLNVIGSILLGIKGLIIGNYLALFFMIFLATYYFKAPTIRKHVDLPTQTKKELYKVSLISACNNGLSQLLQLIDVFVLGLIILDSNIIAAYKVAMTIPTALYFIPSAVCIYIYPYFAKYKNDHKWVIKNYKRVFIGLGLMSACISLILCIFAPFIITFIFGKQYIDAITPFRILALAFFFNSTFKILSGNLLVTQHKLFFNLIISLCAGLTNIIGNVILINKWGSNGAALTTLFVSVFAGLFSTIYFYYTIKRSAENE